MEEDEEECGLVCGVLVFVVVWCGVCVWCWLGLVCGVWYVVSGGG